MSNLADVTPLEVAVELDYSLRMLNAMRKLGIGPRWELTPDGVRYFRTSVTAFACLRWRDSASEGQRCAPLIH